MFEYANLGNLKEFISKNKSKLMISKKENINEKKYIKNWLIDV